MTRLKRSIAVLLAVIMILPFASFAGGEKSDIEGHWAGDKIKYLVNQGVLNGYKDGTLRPDRKITRAEFIKIINSVLGYLELGQVDFEDVDEDDWFHDEISKAVKTGYIKGYKDNTVRPNNPITRQEASLIIATVFEIAEVENIEDDFKDASKIGNWAKDAVNTLKEAGYIEGYVDGTFRPENSLTRAEAATIIVRVIEDRLEINKEELEKRIEEIIVELYGKEADYTKESWDAYAEAMYRAVEVRDNKNATQTEVNAALEELEVKYAALELVETNKEELEKRIEEIIVELFGKEELYKEESWNAYAEAMYRAVAVRDNEEARQTEVNKALEELEAKYGALEIALEESVINKSQIKGYDTIEEAIDDAEAGDVILVREGTYQLSKQLLITKPVTIIGEGEVVIKAAEDFNEGTYSADKHLISIDRVEGTVKLENLTVTNSRRTGVNVFESADVQLKDITSKDNLAAGLTVNNSKVVAENLKTSGNAWYGINVDNGSNPSEGAPETEFILISGEISEEVQIKSDKGGVKVTVAEDYREVNVEGTDVIIWTNRPSENE